MKGAKTNYSEQRPHEKDWLPRSVREVGVERTLKSGEILFRMDSRTVGLFEVVSGHIKLVRSDPSGRETILYTASAGDIVAEASLFSPTYHCDAVATTESVVRLYPKAALLASFESNPQAAQAFMGKLAREIMSELWVLCHLRPAIPRQRSFERYGEFADVSAQSHRDGISLTARLNCPPAYQQARV